MRDPYVYPDTNILKNLANVQDEEELSCMEAEYTSLRLAELVIKESASCFDFAALCDVHHYIFQVVYDWAGVIRVINIEKSEPALGGISIEYSDCFDIEKNAKSILNEMNHYAWYKASIEVVAVIFSKYLAELWKVHPYREGNADLGDKRKPEYLEKIVLDALERGAEMKNRVSNVIKKAGFKATEEEIRRIVYWNRLKHCESCVEEIKEYLLKF